MAPTSRIVAAAVSAVLLLSGCGTKLAGTAAVIGDEVVAEAEINRLVNEVQTQIESMPRGSAPQIPTLVLLTQMVTSHLVLEAVLDEGLRAKGVTVTDAEVQTFKHTIFAQYGKQEIEDQVALQQGVSLQELDNFMRLVYGRQVLGEALLPDGSEEDQARAVIDYLGEISRGMGIQIAPRFGEWNPNKLQVIPGDNTLSRPAPVAPDS